jgi:CelD/BcsL family acetyltransferase involved in cellulose biosynthesis
MATVVPVRDLESSMLGLLAGREERSPFLHPVWLETWLDVFGVGWEARVMALEDGRAIAPLMRQDGRLTFIGSSDVCDFMDFLLPVDAGDAAFAALWRRILGQEWSELHLWGLHEASPTADRVEMLAAAAGLAVERSIEAVSPRLALPETWDEYLAGLAKKDRHELRRKLRRLFESGGEVRLEVLSEREAVCAAMDDFLRLHTRSRSDKAEFMTDAREAFFRRLAAELSERGLIRLFVLRVNRAPGAAVLCFDAGSQLYMYNSGYDPALSGLSVGLVSKALCIRWAIENGKSGLDFLRGDEPYKYDLGARDQRIYTLTVRRGSPA